MFSPNPTTLTIPNGATASQEFDLAAGSSRLPVILLLMAPTALSETVNIGVAEKAGGTFRNLQSGGIDIVLGAGKATIVTGVSLIVIKLIASSPVAADRVFDIVGSAYFIKS